MACFQNDTELSRKFTVFNEVYIKRMYKKNYNWIIKIIRILINLRKANLKKLYKMKHILLTPSRYPDPDMAT